MKTLILKIILILTLFTGFSEKKKIVNGEMETFIAIYEGYNDTGFDDTGYNFSYFDKSLESEAEIIFKTVSKEILKKYNLKNDEYIGEKFKVTLEYIYNEKEEVEIPILKLIIREGI